METNLSPDFNEPLTDTHQYRIPGTYILDKIGSELADKDKHGYNIPILHIPVESVQKIDAITRTAYRNNVKYMVQTKKIEGTI